MAPRVMHLSTYDANGGAARAAYALHRAMVDHGIASRMRVGRRDTLDPTVTGGSRSRFILASELDRRLWRLQRSTNRTWRSPARFASVTAREINRSDADIVHLHWVTDGFLSVEEIGRITKPMVWSMYDMWPFCGTEHYGADEPRARWREGYTRVNRPADESGFDLDRWTYRRKTHAWPPSSRPIHMVPASTWLEGATRSSALMHGWPITRIPHIVDTALFAPMPRATARAELGLGADSPMVLFLASAGIDDRRKGWDLLEQAMPGVRAVVPTVEVVVVGPLPERGRRAEVERRAQVPFHWHGTVSSSADLRLLYCAADVTAVPSREDNMPLTAMEAQSCGCPVVGFRIGGLPEIVDSGRTGYLADAEDVDGLTQFLATALMENRREPVREHAIGTWSPEALVPLYLSVYQDALR